MKAVIMAGGEGSRLRPLTCDLPKPMARLCGRPILEYILELLAEHGVTSAALTLRYLPHRIVDHFPDGSFGGIPLDFVEEIEPLGTAGGVKNACTGEDDEVLVISGDAMCDFDLSAFIAWHRRQGADATILGKRVDDPREYGLIACDDQGVISGFIEKPAFSQAVSDMANTGVYLLSRRALELIPRDQVFDFAKDLFPLMLSRGMNLRCWEGEGYWCDIGDLDSYIRCQQDMLHGRIRCEIHGHRDADGNIFAGERPSAALRITPPIYLGRHVRVEDSAQLQSGSVIDDGCYIGPSARITASILLQDCHIGRRARLTGALVCATASVGQGAMLFEGATLGAGAFLGEGATVNPGIKIWNNKQIPSMTVAGTHVKTAVQSRAFFDDDGITGEIGVELTPEFMARVGAAVGSLNPNVRVAVGCSGHKGGGVLKAALCAGIRSTGAHIIDFGENFQTQFEFSMNFCALTIGVYIRADNHASVKLFGVGGLPATREMERNIETILARGEFVRCSGEDMGDVAEMTGMSTLYKSQLVRCVPKNLNGCGARVKSSNLAVKNTLIDVLGRLGCDTSDVLTLELSAQGDKARIYDPALGYIRHHMIFTWCCLSELERGQDISIPFDAPRVIDEIGAARGRQVLRYFTCPADDTDAAARRLAGVQMWSRDALMQALMFLSAAKRAGGLGALLERTPVFDRTIRTVEVARNPASLLHDLAGEEKSGGIAEGVLLRGERGTALVRPLKRGTGIKIFAEAVSAEISAGICDDIEEILRKNME